MVNRRSFIKSLVTAAAAAWAAPAVTLDVIRFKGIPIPSDFGGYIQNTEVFWRNVYFMSPEGIWCLRNGEPSKQLGVITNIEEPPGY